MGIEHPIRGENPLEVVRFKDQSVNFMATQFSSLVQLRYDIDHGNYPLNWFKESRGGEEALPVNIRPLEGKPGLRAGVLTCIAGSYEWLKEHGIQSYADAVLKWDREREEEDKK